MKYTVLEDRLLCKQIEEEETSESGIIISTGSESNLQVPRKARVIAVGDGLKTVHGESIPMRVKVGDIILIKPPAWHDIQLDGEKYFITCERDVFIVFKQEE